MKGLQGGAKGTTSCLFTQLQNSQPCSQTVNGHIDSVNEFSVPASIPPQNSLATMRHNDRTVFAPSNVTTNAGHVASGMAGVNMTLEVDIPAYGTCHQITPKQTPRLCRISIRGVGVVSRDNPTG